MNVMDERTVLRRAKEILLERGWYRGLEACPNRPCVGFAVSAALGEDDWLTDDPILKRLSKITGAKLRHGSGALAIWNDAPGRTFEEVIDLLDTAIASLVPPEQREEVTV